MKNKIFSVWFREVCSLVFVQSMQALLLTIMLSVVVKLYIGAQDNYVAQQSMGVYAIFILALIPKVELLVKKIFGMGSGVIDDSMMGGKRSLLKTGLALRLGSSVLNNAGKVIGGVGIMAGAGLAGIRQSRISKNNEETANIRGNIDKKKLELGNRSSQGNLTALDTGASGGTTGAALGGYSLDDLTSAIKSANAPDYDEANRKKKHEISQRALKGLQQTTSGFAETAGAMGGAAVGGIVGLGTGGDDLLNDMLIGAGIGDKAGHMATNLTLGTVVAANELGYQYGVGKREVQKSKEKKNKAQQEYDELVKQASSQTRRVSTSRATPSPGPTNNTNASSRTISGAKTMSTSAANKSNTKTSSVKTASQLTAEQKKVYEKAKTAKKAGNMDEYHKNMDIAAGMMKQQKITETKSSTSSGKSTSSNTKSDTSTRSYTPTTPNGSGVNNINNKPGNDNGINDIGNI